TITADVGNHTVLGDNGTILYNAAGAAYSYDTTDAVNTTGGVDTITLGDATLTTGDTNVVLGGVGGDVITTLGTSTDLVLGDNGTVLLDPTTLDLVSVTSDGFAGLDGNDQITLGDGTKTVVGGYGDDTIIAAVGDHTVLGDNGTILYNAAGAAYSYDTTDAVNTTGG